MLIHVNGKPLEVSSATMAALLRELEFENDNVATALNQIFIRKSARAETGLKDGDAVEILSPRQGG
jgi:sulfur carrier protein